MKNETISFLRCPECGQGLRLEACKGIAEDIVGGLLLCDSGHSYLVKEGIPRFLEVTSESVKKTVASFGFEWTRFRADMEEEDRKIFLSETLFVSEELTDKLVLDAGCGQGWYSRAAAFFKARVIGLDASVSVDRAEELNPNHAIDYIQANLLNLPLAKESFDIIFSLGVLHHTENPALALKNLSLLLKKSGIISFWVYGITGRFSEFKCTLAPHLKKFRLPLFLILKIREFNSRTLRKISTRLPNRFLYSLAYLAVPLGRSKLFNTFIPVSTYPDFRLRINDTFDWYAPKIQSLHTKREVSRWCAEAGLEIIGWISTGIVPKFGVRAHKI